MATSIDNLDGLNGVTGITAGDETLIKAILKELFFHLQFRAIGLFIGQMTGEAFIDAEDGDLRAQVASPTIRVNFYGQGANKLRVTMDEYVGSAWKERHIMQYPGVLSQYVTP
jgi:hypothetical protein